MMRRLLPLAALLALAACDSYVDSPVDGFGNFIGDTLTFSLNPNRPDGDAANMLRVTGQGVTPEPLKPEDGNVWPGDLPPIKTLADLQKEGPTPLGDVPGSPSLPTTRSPVVPPLSIAPPPASQPTPGPKPQSRVFQTPSGPVVTSIGGNGIETFTSANGMTGTVINNGNGTATLIRADGTSSVVPVPR